MSREPPEVQRITTYDMIKDKTIIPDMTEVEQIEWEFENELLRFITEDTLDKILPIIKEYTVRTNTVSDKYRTI